MAEQNRRKHGVSFELAVRVMDDPLAASRPDPHGDVDRWQTIGMPSIASTVVLFVVHTAPEGEEAGRIISARLAENWEKRAYLSPELDAELRALEALPPASPSLQDAENLAAWRRDAECGRFYRPRKISPTLRIDADVVDFFECQGPGYQTRMNAALRRAVLAEDKAEPTPRREPG